MNEVKMNEHETDGKCELGFNGERIFVAEKVDKGLLKRIGIPVSIELRCNHKPRLSKSDREDLGYHYKGGKLYNLNFSEVPACIFCKNYKE